MSKRVEILKEKMLSEDRYASIEQAKIITKVYRENEGEKTPILRAKALKKSLEEMEIAIEPEERIVGNRTKGVRAGVIFPEGGMDWVWDEIDELETRPQDQFKVRPEDVVTFKEEIYPFWEGKTLENIIDQRYGKELKKIKLIDKINQTDHAQGHIIPDCPLWLEKGPKGLLKIAEAHLEKEMDEEKRTFYQSVMITMEGAIAFIERYETLARTMAKENSNEESLLQVADVCKNIAKKPATTFHEALQLTWFLFVILQMESNASSFSPGRMDQYLWKYYQNDLCEKRLTKEDAQELVECLFLKFNQIVYLRSRGSAKYFAGFPIGFNIALGGTDENGKDTSNELSFIFLQAQKTLGLPQPNLSVRLHENTPDDFLKEAIRVVSKGSGMPQFFNDKSIVQSMMDKLGIERKDAYNYAIVGCVELTTQGNNLGWSDAAMFNLNKALELTLTGGVDLLSGKKIGPDFGNLTTYDTYEDLEKAYNEMIDYYVERMIKACEIVEQAHMDILPSPFLSAVIDDCLENGKDVTKGGAKYNLSGVQMIQIANVADSLIALKKLVFEEQRMTKEELLEALRTDFKDAEVIQALLLNKAPKYGNDIAEVDEIGRKWARKFADKLKEYTNYRGGKYHTGMYTVSAHVPMGQNVGASPDGRNSREPLADGGMSPVYGRDIDGPTAVLKSVSKLDNYLTTNGGLLNMKFLPSFFETEEGIDKFAKFMRTFVDLEIPHIQFNVVNKDQLVEAKKHPEQYKTLTVRVAGYTAYFTELAPDLQEEIIARTSYGEI